MAFERIALQVGKVKASAGITITQHGKTVIALRKDVVASVGFKAKDTFSALLGTDDDHGKLRIVAAKDGVACARELKRTGAFFFNLGVVPVIGLTPHKQRPIEARVVDGGIEIDIPEDDGPKLLAPPKPKASAAATTGGGAPKAAKGEEIFFNGVTIDLTEGEESVTFDGDGIAISEQEARLVMLLARPRPAPVADSFLIKELWGKPAPRDAVEQLRGLATGDLKKSLASIGLDLNPVKGVGYQLKDA